MTRNEVMLTKDAGPRGQHEVSIVGSISMIQYDLGTTARHEVRVRREEDVEGVQMAAAGHAKRLLLSRLQGEYYSMTVSN